MSEVIMDLADFVPETYVIRFAIEGRPYEVRYAEARVDEVLQLLLESTEKKPLAELIQSRRKYVTELFVQNLVVGDPAQLAEDLKLLPYTSLRDGLDIYVLYVETQSRVKKKPNGALPAQIREPNGFLAKLRSWLKPAKAA